MEKTKKITAQVPVDTLRRARAATGKGITETVRRGLELLASAAAAAELRRLRGKVHLDLAALRQDRGDRPREDSVRIRVSQWGTRLAAKLSRSLVVRESHYDLHALLARVTPDNLRGESDTGRAMGREEW